MSARKERFNCFNVPVPIVSEMVLSSLDLSELRSAEAASSLASLPLEREVAMDVVAERFIAWSELLARLVELFISASIPLCPPLRT